MRAARALVAVVASASMVGLVACNAIFGLDPLTYEPRPSIPLPLPPEEADAADGSADGDTNEADAADGARMDAADGADATSQADADPSDAADD